VRLDPTIDPARATDLLADLCDLYRQAVSTPLGCFGKTAGLLATDREQAHDAFMTFTQGRHYATSSEVVVHGGQPEFEGVFPDDPALIRFFSRFGQRVNVNRQYIYTPDAS
jgi:hypothetical protein